MPQLDFNTFAGVAWWLTIIFYLSYIWIIIVPVTRIVASSKALSKYSLFKMLQLSAAAEELEKSSTASKENVVKDSENQDSVVRSREKTEK